MFELVASGLAVGDAGAIVNAIYNGMSIAAAVSLYTGFVGTAAFVLSNGIKWMIKWAGKDTIIKW
ncbi:hypothetical protein B7C51_24575 (plasmid) [Paenibacillus larvae subsp. pulvifaciens]|uniref:Circular bacteriocin, circularin A/uberolysin family n=1 Tax=Paenibacillus larvae subsp. pulvifaciens TaxID=1477 RepID=A0A1V0UZM7_9BACL|nr:hypothetical protein [Paenibacillus larvae]ARF70654.1 hypothetical protein B7C51_24575 [Paenibacillus larvae subsp. pulvifaciens]